MSDTPYIHTPYDGPTARQEEIAEDVETLHEKVEAVVKYFGPATLLLKSAIDVVEIMRTEAVRELSKLREASKSDTFRDHIDYLIDRIEAPELETPFFDLDFPTLQDAIDDAIELDERDQEARRYE